nr:hypothetical protein Itr_chr05CG09510 [Ipomoea trifida]
MIRDFGRGLNTNRFLHYCSRCSRFGHILMECRKGRNSRLVPGDGLAGMAEEEAVANEGDVLVDYVWWKRDGR